MLSIHDKEFEEDDWDPSGVNAMSFTIGDSDEDEDKKDEDEEDDDLEEVVAVIDDEEDVEENENADTTDLDVDGLTELERMEKQLRKEEDPLQEFAIFDEE